MRICLVQEEFQRTLNFFSHRKPILNKTVLLCERKRHTTRHVASTPCAALAKVGTPQPRQVPPRQCRYPLAKVGTHPAKVGTLRQRQVPPSQGRYPLAKISTVSRPRQVPLWTDRLMPVKTLPSRRSTYAGGKYLQTSQNWIFCRQGVLRTYYCRAAHRSGKNSSIRFIGSPCLSWNPSGVCSFPLLHVT